MIAIAPLLVWGTLSLQRVHDSGPLKEWFNGLHSQKGYCCSNSDGRVLSNVDWIVRDGHYWVLLEGRWTEVPDGAVLHEPNLAGPTMVWPLYVDGRMVVRCFMPGSGT
ncbi:MAG TPA: hypothetical protein VN203_09060 [Candidatus Acidoferrum sp.]|nr:hypothetical protein [Candidatus Methylomirabilis sp.]HWU37794.1 hypothetical protein [Candidatus Acidoferrum sp.]